MSTQLHTQRARCPSFSPCGGVLVAGGKPAAHVNTIDTQPTQKQAGLDTGYALTLTCDTGWLPSLVFFAQHSNLSYMPTLHQCFACPSTPLLLCSPCSYPTRGLGSATNSPELPKLPLSRKHRGQRTTNVTGTTPAMSYPLYVSDMVCKSPYRVADAVILVVANRKKEEYTLCRRPSRSFGTSHGGDVRFSSPPLYCWPSSFQGVMPFVLPKTNHGLEPHPVLPSLSNRARIELALSFAM